MVRNEFFIRLYELLGKELGNRTDINELNQIPNVGPATINYLNMLGIYKPFELIGKNPYTMFEKLCKISDQQIDPCLADVFISAVRFMEGGPPKKWWDFTQERKLYYRACNN